MSGIYLNIDTVSPATGSTIIRLPTWGVDNWHGESVESIDRLVIALDVTMRRLDLQLAPLRKLIAA